MTRSVKHLRFMELMEHGMDKTEEERLDEELDRSRDNDYIRHIVHVGQGS